MIVTTADFATPRHTSPECAPAEDTGPELAARAEPATGDATEELPALFVDMLLDSLSTTIPGHVDDGPAMQIGRWRAARMLFEAMRARTPVEAVLAARAVAAHYASMDMYARAAQRDTTDEKALRLRSSANAASRSFDTALRTLEKRQGKQTETPREADGAASGTPAPQSPIAGEGPQPAGERVAPVAAAVTGGPVPGLSTRGYLPRDKFGEPIPLWREECMSQAQRRAAGCPPNDACHAALVAEAIAEEAAMLAEQACLGASAAEYGLGSAAAEPAAGLDTECPEAGRTGDRQAQQDAAVVVR
jgi:hypothetical protein